MPPRGQPVLPDCRTPRASADSKGVHRPMFSKLPFRGGLLPVGESPRPRPSPPLVPRPALGVEAPRVPVQAFGPRCWDDVPPRHHRASIRYPVWEPLRFSLFAWSPPLVRVAYPRALRVSPYGQHDEMTLRFHHPTPPAIVRDPHPSGGSRPEAPPLARPYSDARPYDPPPLLR
jgi:hypothetical protein